MKKAEDLTGRRFGYLTVIGRAERQNGRTSRECRCDCGGQTEVTENGLMHGNNRSCGCLKKEVQDKINSQLHRVDGTCVEILEKRKYRRDNTSGFRGVYVTKGHRFRVSIGFKGKRYHVGTFHDYDEAVSARMEAEKLIHEGFIRAYYDWKERAEDSQWAKTHPFVYNVEKRNGKFCIVTENGQQTV